MKAIWRIGLVAVGGESVRGEKPLRGEKVDR